MRGRLWYLTKLFGGSLVFAFAVLPLFAILVFLFMLMCFPFFICAIYYSGKWIITGRGGLKAFDEKMNFFERPLDWWEEKMDKIMERLESALD